LLGHAIAEKTKSGYMSAARRFIAFTEANSIEAPFPLDDHVLMGFVAALSLEAKPLAPRTVKTYLCGLKHWHRLACGTVFTMSPRLELLIKGYSRQLARGRRPRLAVTTAILHGLKPLINLETPQGKILWAVLTVGVFGLLRLGEILDLLFSDISFEVSAHTTTCMVVNIKKSKTDQFRKGARVRVFMLPDTASDICPVRAMRAWLSVRSPTTPGISLWQRPPAKKLTRADVVDPLQELVRRFALANGLDWDPSQFSGHSLRRGGASGLFAAGVSAEIIRIMGRWKSECYKLYLETSHSLLLGAQLAMAHIKFGQVWPICPNAWDREE
jgi:integrase